MRKHYGSRRRPYHRCCAVGTFGFAKLQLQELFQHSTKFFAKNHPRRAGGGGRLSPTLRRNFRNSRKLSLGERMELGGNASTHRRAPPAGDGGARARIRSRGAGRCCSAGLKKGRYGSEELLKRLPGAATIPRVTRPLKRVFGRRQASRVHSSGWMPLASRQRGGGTPVV